MNSLLFSTLFGAPYLSRDLHNVSFLVPMYNLMVQFFVFTTPAIKCAFLVPYVLLQISARIIMPGLSTCYRMKENKLEKR